jgi:Calcineurin-like phosphoesterase
MKNASRNTVVVLVVDDQHNDPAPTGRLPTYQACWSLLGESLKGQWQFDMRYVDSPEAIHANTPESGQPALAVVDMVLESALWTDAVVAEFDDWLLHQSIPTILVSQHFHQPAALSRANKLTKGLARGGVPFQFMLWQDVVAAASNRVIAGQLAFLVGTLLSLARGRDQLFEKEPGESVRLLHITDPHFGKATWNAGALAVLCGRFRDLGLSVADFLLITGDISNRALPKEYDEAEKYLQALAHNGLMAPSATKLSCERVLMVPGNHDYSRPLALAANLVEVSKDKYELQERPQPHTDWINLQARGPYADFERKLAGRERAWTPEPGFRIDSRFVTAGLHFVELDIERNSIEGYQSGMPDKEIRDRLNLASKAIRDVRTKGECVAVLAHRHVIDAWTSLDAMLKDFFAGLATEGPVILLCGHEHDPRVASEYSKQLLLIRGVPAVSGPTLPPGNLPKIHYVELKRLEGRVNGACVHTFHQGIGEWLSSGKECDFSWTAAGGWS